MAIPKIKATYSLDAETAHMLDRLAERWNTSKSETLRRLIRAGNGTDDDEPSRRVAALLQLQKNVGLTAETAGQWMKDVRAERQASSGKRARTSLTPRNGKIG